MRQHDKDVTSGRLIREYREAKRTVAIIEAKVYRLGEALGQLAHQLHDEHHTIALEGQGGELPSNFLGNKERPDAGRIKPNRLRSKIG